MNVRILIMLLGLSYFLLACGGGSSGESNAVGGVVNPVTTSDFKGVKLTLADKFSGNSVESDYYLYSNGEADYIVRSIGQSYPATTRLQWTFEGGSLFVNNGSKKLGSGLASPKEIQVSKVPEVGDVVRQKSGNSVYYETMIIDVGEAILTDVNLSNIDFYGKAFEFSGDGSASSFYLTRLKFTDLESGIWESGNKSKSFTWSLLSSNTLRIRYNSTDYVDYEFRNGLSLGEPVFNLSVYGERQFTSETMIVNSYLL